MNLIRRRVEAIRVRLEAITVTAANLRGQLHELSKLRDQIRNAQVLAQRSQHMRQLFGGMQRHPVSDRADSQQTGPKWAVHRDILLKRQRHLQRGARYRWRRERVS
jgi:hypothetical protein